LNWRITLKEQDGFGRIVEGINAVEAALSNGRVEKVIVLETYRSTKAKNIINYCLETELTVDKVDKANWPYSERYSIAGICKPLTFVGESDFSLIDGTNIVVCLNLKDTNNIGAIARSALAFNFLTVAVPKKRSAPINSSVISSSAGAVENLNFLSFNSIFSLLKKMKKNNYWVIGLDALVSKPIDVERIKEGKIALIIGNEDKGLSSEVINKLDGIYNIRISDKMESLNASVAAGIIMEKIFNKT
tara:strand:+ start:592 stop:1329 length:738 start_codon:yes stop_codon:yes gene_type:complete